MNIKKIQALTQYFGCQINFKALNDASKFKERSFQIPVKEKILMKLYDTVNQENGIDSDMLY